VRPGGWTIIEGKKRVLCGVCDEHFLTPISWEAHMLEEHPKHPHTDIIRKQKKAVKA